MQSPIQKCLGEQTAVCSCEMCIMLLQSLCVVIHICMCREHIYICIYICNIHVWCTQEHLLMQLEARGGSDHSGPQDESTHACKLRACCQVMSDDTAAQVITLSPRAVY